MREIIVSTETNTDLSEEYIAENKILVIPHYYNVEEKVYGEPGNTLTIKEFYDEMRAGKKVGTAASNPAVMNALKAMVRKELGYTEFMIAPIGPSIGAHSGPGTLGLAFLADER